MLYVHKLQCGCVHVFARAHTQCVLITFHTLLLLLVVVLLLIHDGYTGFLALCLLYAYKSSHTHTDV